VHIYNILGKQVLNTKTINNGIDVSNLKKGVYMIEIVSNKFSTIKKIIKQ